MVNPVRIIHSEHFPSSFSPYIKGICARRKFNFILISTLFVCKEGNTRQSKQLLAITIRLTHTEYLLLNRLQAFSPPTLLNCSCKIVKVGPSIPTFENSTCISNTKYWPTSFVLLLLQKISVQKAVDTIHSIDRTMHNKNLGTKLLQF